MKSALHVPADARRATGRMRRILKGVLWLVGGVCLLLVLAICGFLLYRAMRQHQNAERLAIHAPSGIQEGMFVEIGGQRQWITIRGQNRNNPVLLVIDGGPGTASSVFAPSPWENDFTVVEWDQPGAGKTFTAAGSRIAPDLTIDTDRKGRNRYRRLSLPPPWQEENRHICGLMGNGNRHPHDQGASGPFFRLCRHRAAREHARRRNTKLPACAAEGTGQARSNRHPRTRSDRSLSLSRARGFQRSAEMGIGL